MNTNTNTEKKDIAQYIEEIIQAYITSFLLIILFTFYRRFRGIPFTELHEQITAGYLKFLLVFLLAGAGFYVFFLVVLKRRFWLDLLLFIFGLSAIIMTAGFLPDAFHLHLVLLFFAALLCYYFFVYREAGSGAGDLSGTTAGWLLAAIFLLSILLVPQVGIMRHRVFLTSGFDLGIFDQMFYHMAKGQPPITTIYFEPVNHLLEVHFSPIFYLILPVYKLLPSPKTLIFMQCFFVALAVFPLYHLCRAHQLERKYSLIFCVLFLTQPAILGGEFRDFHENKLLAFFLLTFILLCERKKVNYLLISLSWFLTVIVREDASIYILVYCIYRFFDKKETRKAMSIIFFITLVYFILVLNLIVNMDMFSYRYKEILPAGAEQTLLDLLKVFFSNPLYILVQSFSVEKMKLIGLLLLPLVLLPLTGLSSLKKAFLFVPFLTLAVLQDSQWQNVNAQYYYGIICFFFLITLQFVVDYGSTRLRNALLALMLCSTVIFSLSSHIGKKTLFRYWEKDHQIYEQMEVDFSSIPETATVTAPNHFFPHLSRRDLIHPHVVEGQETDYILVDLRDDILRIPPEKIISYFSAPLNYGTVKFLPDWYLILKKGYSKAMNAEVADYLSYLD